MIGPSAPNGPGATNDAEKRLLKMLERAGFNGAVTQKEIQIGPPYGRTLPDVFFEDPNARILGVCIYLDGMSDRLHGNPSTQAKDKAIREYLRAEGYEVLSIPVGDLDDPSAMKSHLFWLGMRLANAERAKALRDSPEAWFGGDDDGSGAAVAGGAEGDRAGPEDTEFDGWARLDDLLEPEWHQLAFALRGAGIPAPDDFHRDLEAGPMEQRMAVMWWGDSRAPIAIVAHGTATADPRHIAVDPMSDATPVIERLRSLFGA